MNRVIDALDIRVGQGTIKHAEQADVRGNVYKVFHALVCTYFLSRRLVTFRRRRLPPPLTIPRSFRTFINSGRRLQSLRFIK